jgi:hypothetical protein
VTMSSDDDRVDGSLERRGIKASERPLVLLAIEFVYICRSRHTVQHKFRSTHTLHPISTPT